MAPWGFRSAVWSSSGSKNLPAELAVCSSKAIQAYLSLLSFFHSAFLPVKQVSLPGATLSILRAPTRLKNPCMGGSGHFALPSGVNGW